jgi:regulator-associated protein of mTOR
MGPDLPADLFTACLTTPIPTALRWFAKRSLLSTAVTEEMIASLPGTPHARKSPFGELNWIFTAITDTIAWSTLPTSLFHKLFRQDLLVASMFRNFLLAQRIMRR